MPDVSAHRQTLIDERNSIQKRLQDNERFGQNLPMNDSVSELSGYDQHPADLGSEMFEREKDLALREHDMLRLEQIENALAQMAQGQYGICERCGQAIEQMRLEAEPAATFCIRCKEELDTPRAVNDRPVEEEALWPPFARTNMDGRDYTGFDGEDSWQAVAMFNNRRTPEPSMDDEAFDEDSGYVEPIEQISNIDYERQLPD